MNLPWEEIITGLVAFLGGGGAAYAGAKKLGRPPVGNGNGTWTKEAHDEICTLKLKPMGKRLDGIDSRFDGLDHRLEKMDTKLDRILLNGKNNG